MARFIALLLVLCTAGVIFADAQCGVACTANECNTPQTETSCHHHRQPSSQQCLHQHDLTQTWIRTASSPAVQLLATDLDVPSLDVPVANRATGTAMFKIASVQPPGPSPQTALRI